MSDERAFQRVAREHAMLSQGTGGTCNCATCQASREVARLTRQVTELREAMELIYGLVWNTSEVAKIARPFLSSNPAGHPTGYDHKKPDGERP